MEIIQEKVEKNVRNPFVVSFFFLTFAEPF
jgi:hypothetical protein